MLPVTIENDENGGKESYNQADNDCRGRYEKESNKSSANYETLSNNVLEHSRYKPIQHSRNLKRSLSQSSTGIYDSHSMIQSRSPMKPTKFTMPTIKRSVTGDFHKAYTPDFPDQSCPSVNNTATLPIPRSSSEELNASSLHTLAMACEITTDTIPTTNQDKISKPIDEVKEEYKAQPSKASSIATSQDATKPYSNLSNEWVVPSRPTGENTSPANSLSVTSPISINDVLCGRGGLTNHHPGNIFFRKLVRHNQESYLLATKRDKAGVAKGIVDKIRSLNPPGRFLKKARDISANGVWVEIGDRKAREKTSQALRERAPELREELECQVRQQQKPPLNVISSDEKMPMQDFCVTQSNQTNASLESELSNALVGPNVVLRREVTCDSASTSGENLKTSSPKRRKVNNFPISQQTCKRPSTILSMAPSIPCSIQARTEIRTISSSSEDELFGGEQTMANHNISHKGTPGGPLKKRIQKVA